jgi:hypothetical protein
MLPTVAADPAAEVSENVQKVLRLSRSATNDLRVFDPLGGVP